MATTDPGSACAMHIPDPRSQQASCVRAPHETRAQDFRLVLPAPRSSLYPYAPRGARLGEFSMATMSVEHMLDLVRAHHGEEGVIEASATHHFETSALFVYWRIVDGLRRPHVALFSTDEDEMMWAREV